ncbi:unnamed protein product, partial [marine sediment metagenome]
FADIIGFHFGTEGFKLERLGLNRGNGGLNGAGHYISTSPE